MRRMVYLDNNATTRVLDSVAEAMRPFLVERFSNPASAMGEFEGVSRAITAAKSRIARVLKADDPQQIVATSGATEANNLAILGAARANGRRRHLITSAVEHPSVLETCKYLESTGYQLTILPVSTDGIVTADAVMRALQNDTLLVSIMLANNETGVILPVADIARAVKDAHPEVLVHTDATQAVGKIPVDLDGGLVAVDLLSFSAHKFHGPKGVGALFVRRAGDVAPLFYGGGQQAALRPGTENPAGVIGAAAALDAVRGFRYEGVQNLRDRIQDRFLTLYPSAFVLGATTARLPTTLCICVPGIKGGDLVDRLAAVGVAISTGSACAHGANKPSHVALAMGLTHAQADCCVRISLSIETTEQEVKALDAAIATVFSPWYAAAVAE